MGEALVYLLDSNIISEPFRPQPSISVIDALDQHGDVVAISAVTWGELLYGLGRLEAGKKKTRLEHYLFEIIRPNIPILPYEALAAQWHGQERARLTKRGLTPSFADSQIAAIAATKDLTLVTRNLRDFESFHGLRLENWFDPTS